jgi:hypothetical protein
VPASEQQQQQQQQQQADVHWFELGASHSCNMLRIANCFITSLSCNTL